MYYDDEPKGNKLKLLMIIGGVVLVLLLLIFVVSCAMKKKTNKPEPEAPKDEVACELEVVEGTLNKNDEYEGEVKISFKSKTPASIRTYGIGTAKTYNTSETYLITTKGEKTIYGYVKDAEGKEGTCQITIIVSDGTGKEEGCELEAKGTIGEPGWYKSKVEVSFKKKADTGVKIYKFGIGEMPVDESKTEGTADEDNKKIDIPYNEKETYVIEKDGKFDVYGIVEDYDRNILTCKITVRIDTTAPTCTLKASGNKSGNTYTSDVVVEFDTIKDDLSKDFSKGVGLEKNYTKASHTVTSNGSTKVYGYIKDEAGNEGTCEMAITKGSGSSGGGGGTTPPPPGDPACSLRVKIGKVGSNDWYTSNVEVEFASKSNATSFGVATDSSPNYNGKTSVSVTSDGTYTVYGFVKNSAGKTAVCSFSVKKDSSTPVCSLKLSGSKSGDTYTGAVTVALDYSGTNSASGVSKYGIGKSQTLDNKSSISVTSNGTHSYNGYVQNGAGTVGTCSTSFTIDTTKNILSNQGKVGDLVAYDAGNWSETKALPTTNSTPFSFGGYSNGKSRNTGINCANGSESGSGWRILSISGTTVTLIHASTPECFYHPYVTNQTNLAYNSERILRGASSGAPNALYSTSARSWAMYVNSSFATKAEMFTKGMLDAYAGKTVASPTQMTDVLIKTNTDYYLSTALNTVSLWGVNASGYVQGYSQRVYGVRPVVTLKAGINTSGKNASGAWVLTQ